MKFGKVFFVLFSFSFIFSILEVNAQNSESSKQIRILNNYGSIPFEDGKTIIAEVVFTGLDPDYGQSDEAAENLLTESSLFRVLRGRRFLIHADEEFYGYKVSSAVKAIRDWLDSDG